MTSSQDKREEFPSNSSLLYTSPPFPPLPKEAKSLKPEKKGQWLKQALFIFSFLLVFVVFGYHCPIYWLIHLHCPGCGMTRAALSLIQGDLTASLSWHALLIPTFVILGVSFFLSRKYSKISQGLLWVWIFLMIVYWIYRLIFVFPNVLW